MGRRRSTNTVVEGRREALALAATIGGTVRLERRRRRMTQAELAQRVGVDQSRISQLELGRAMFAPLATWVALGIALGRPLSVAFSRALEVEPADAGHLAMQELVLRLARRNDWRGTFELPTRPSDPSRSIDVCVRDDHRRVLIVVECWNRIGDVGSAARSTARKIAEAEALAAVSDRGPGYVVRACWLLRPTAANRRLLRDHPEVFRSRFPGSSVAWTRSLEHGMEPPAEPGIAWLDVAAGRVVPIRLRSG